MNLTGQTKSDGRANHGNIKGNDDMNLVCSLITGRILENPVCAQLSVSVRRSVVIR